MKRNLLLGILLFPLIAYSQVGINTTTPGTTLDVNGAITNREAAVAVASNAATIPANVSQVQLTGAATAQIGITAPAAPNAGQRLIIYNNTTGGFTASLNSNTIPNGQAMEFAYSNGNWRATNGGTPIGGWNLLGNTGTSPASNFLGTTDNQDMVMRTNNTEKMRIQTNGNVGIGTSTPLSTTHIMNQGTGGPLVGTSNPTNIALRMENAGNDQGVTLDFETKNAAGVSRSAVIGVNPSFNTNGVFVIGRSGLTNDILVDLATGHTGMGDVPSPTIRFNLADATSTNDNPIARVSNISPIAVGNKAIIGFNSYNGGGSAWGIGSEQISTTAVDSRFNFYYSTGGGYSKFMSIKPQNIGNAAQGAYVGINNINPTAALDVVGSAKIVDGTQGAGKIFVSDTNGLGSWQTAASAVGTSAWGITGNTGTSPASNFLGTTDNQDMVFRTNNTEKMRVQAGGFVGVGTSNPSAKLHVDGGESRFSNGTSVWGLNPSIVSGIESFEIIDRVSSVRRQIFRSNGNVYIGGTMNSVGAGATISTVGTSVGINNINPTAALDVVGSAKIVDGTQGAGKILVSDANGLGSWQTASSAVGTSAWGIAGNTGTSPASNFLGTIDNQDMVFRTNNTEKMRVQAGGFVGIGAPIPHSKFDLGSDVASKKLAVYNNSAGTDFYGLGLSGGLLQFHVGAAPADAPDMVLNSSGNLGIGVGATTPTNKLTVAGGTSIGSGYISQAAPTDGAIIEGFVGLGTSTPLHMLDLGDTAGGSVTDFGGKKLAVFQNSLGTTFYGLGESPDVLQFHAKSPANGAPGMVLTSAGNVGIGNTSPVVRLDITSSNDIVTNMVSTATTLNGGIIQLSKSTAATSGDVWTNFMANGSTVGYISSNSASTVAYNTTSDIRLKENIRNTHFGITDLMKIQVSDYNYKTDKTTAQTGFIAQQLYTIFPSAVTKGGDDASKNPWAVDYGKITPLLVKAVQEQQKEIEELKMQNAKLSNVVNQTLDIEKKYTQLLQQVDEMKHMLGTKMTQLETKVAQK